MKTRFTERAQRMIAWSIIAMAFVIVIVTGISDLVEAEEILRQTRESMHFMQEPHAKQSEEVGLPWYVVMDHGVKARSGPGLNYEERAQVRYGSSVEVIGEKNGWYQCFHWTCPEPVWIWGEYLEFK